MSQTPGPGGQSEDEKLFALLDSHSQPLRSAAKDFADYLATLKNSGSSELYKLIDALNNIHSSPIEKIDQALENLKRGFMVISRQKLSVDELEQVHKKYNVLMSEAINLFRKASELDQGK